MPFKVPRYTIFCCGCSLRTGVYIIGAINIVLFLLVGAEQITYLIMNRRFEYHLATDNFLENDLFDLTIFARIIMAIFLIYGCYNDNPSYMLGFVLMQVIFITLLILSVLMFLIIHIVGIPAEEILIDSIGTAIEGYSAIIVFSHYRNLKEGRSITT
uniref:Protein rhodnius neglectus n=1 Tax=Rhodnius prolixus TaxID=13249 RepID=A0A4P6DC17_RHOPR